MRKMGTLKFSKYAFAIEEESGDFTVLSSFMGAVLKLPRAEIYRPDIPRQLLKKWRAGDVLAPDGWASKRVVDMLLINRFLYSTKLEEAAAVGRVLKQEAEKVFHLIILPHEDCNFRCVYCYETFERGIMPKPVATGLKQFVRDRIANGSGEFTAFNVSWFGGEPCLAMGVIDDLSASFIEDCARSEINYRSSMTTNGYFLDAHNLERLHRDQVEHFQVTLDGPRETHDVTRHLRGGQGTFDRIYRNLLGVHRSDLEASVTVRVNVTPENRASLPELISDFERDFDGDARFSLDFHAVGHWGGPNDQQYDVIGGETAFDVCLGLAKQAADAGFAPEPLKRMLCSHGGVCYAGKQNSVVVGSNGALYKCTVALTDDRNKVGQLRVDGVLEIDQSKWASWVSGSEGSSKCQTCSFMPSCQGKSCPLETLNEHGVPPCPMTESQLASLLRITAGSYVPA